MGVPRHGSTLIRMRRSQGLREHLDDTEKLLVVLAPGLEPGALTRFDLPADATVHSLGSPMPRPDEYDVILLAARDLTTLRRAATGVGNFGQARRVGIWIDREVGILPSVTPRPEWPRLEQLTAARTPDHFVLLEFADPAPARPVLLHLARAASYARTFASGWPTIGVLRADPGAWPAADPAATVAFPKRLFDTSVDSPPDLVLAADTEGLAESFAQPHPVLGRAPQLRALEPDLSWNQLAELTDSEAAQTLDRRGVTSLGGIDERVLNPIGFDREPIGDPVPLEPDGPTDLTVRTARGRRVRLEGGQGLSDADVPLLRGLPGVKLEWRGSSGPQAYCRTVLGMAMSGVPLVSDEVPGWARLLLSGELTDVLSSPADLHDRLAREEHSIRIRRAALRTHATGPWRKALAQAHGLQSPSSPRVSVLLVTRRSEMLPFALRQLARQQNVDFEVVLATHGFEADPTTLAAFEEGCSAHLGVFSADSQTLFGEVLNEAATRATGDVLLKMDDDDWYGPEFISDLMLARGYTGAEIVGCPPEFTFVEPLWLTTRRLDDTEVFRPFVAGGTMLIDRATFRSLGGFRHTKKYVDANLLSAVINAGGSVYRTHGLGYVLRRGSQGHTWDPGLGYFVTRKRAPEQWRGFRPSSLLEASSADLPAKPEDERVST
jgi:hypothetical protein